MNIAYKRLYALFFFIITNTLCQNLADDTTVLIKVLLDKKCNLTSTKWNISSENGFNIIGIKDKEKKIINTKSTSFTVTSQDGKLKINNKYSNFDKLFIKPKNNLFKFLDTFYNEQYPNKKYNVYEGTVEISLVDNCAYFINHIDIENYVAAVGLAESVPGWPDEANKAMCIAFRSYGVAKILEQREINKKLNISQPYDIQNSNYHQVYKGIQKSDHFRKIAEATKGLVLAHKNKPILAMFDICCGGAIPSKKQGFNFVEAPYLARTYPCNYCKNYKYYNWEYKYKIKELEDILRQEFPKLKGLKEIKIVKKDKTGTVFRIRIQDKHGYHYITGKRLKALLKKFKSLSYNIERSGNYIVFKGIGHGHLMGLCQHGAFQMDKNKWDYKKILKFFYPGVTLMKLQKIDKKII